MTLRVAIMAGTIHGNRGAEAMLCTVIGCLRDRLGDCTFEIFSYYPREDRELVDDPGVGIVNATPFYTACVLFPCSILLAICRILRLGWCEQFFPTAVQAAGDSDILLDIAGVSFVDGREVFLLYNTLSLWPFMLLGVPVLKLAQAIGPIESLPNRIGAGITLPRCTRIFARGDQTYAYLCEKGYQNADRAADVAFLYQDRFTLSNEPLQQDTTQWLSQRSLATPTVALCPSAVLYKQGGAEYLKFVVTLVDQLLDAGRRVILFPNATRLHSESPRNNDLRVIGQVIALSRFAGSDRLAWVDHDINTQAIRVIITHADVVVTSRFHAMIAALSLAVPVFVVGWSHKYREVMADFHQHEWECDWQGADGSRIARQVDRLMAKRDEVVQILRSRLPEVYSRSESQIDWVVRYLHEKTDLASTQMSTDQHG